MEEVRVGELFQQIPVTGFFDIETLAKDDGYKQHPDAGATTIGASEKKIIHTFSDLLNENRKKAIEALTALETKKSEIFVDGIIQTAESIPDNTRDKVNSSLMSAREEMFHLQSEEQHQYSAKQIFMIENCLNRPADYPLSHMLDLALFCVVILLESLGNAYFFAANNDLGLFGGWFQAAVVSLANVVFLAGLAGFSFRYCNHVVSTKKLWGWLVDVMCGFAAVAFNLLVAHYRVAIQQDADTALSEATKTFFQNPLGIANFEGWVLFIIGMGCSLVACYKWYYFDDPYPGYGKKDRKHKQAQEACREKQKQILNAVTGFFDSAAKELNDAMINIEKQTKLFQGLFGISQSIIGQYPLYVTHVQEVCSNSVNNYRNINRSVRATPPPTYFDDPITLDGPIGLPYKSVSEAELKQLTRKRDNFMTNTKQKISAELRKLRETIDREVQKFFSNIEQDAKQRVKIELEDSRNVQH